MAILRSLQENYQNNDRYLNNDVDILNLSSSNQGFASQNDGDEGLDAAIQASLRDFSSDQPVWPNGPHLPPRTIPQRTAAQQEQHESFLRTAQMNAGCFFTITYYFCIFNVHFMRFFTRHLNFCQKSVR